jgi:SH3 domain-containing YSC84-like protein 1
MGRNGLFSWYLARGFLGLAAIAAGLSPQAAGAQTPEIAVVEAATGVLQEIMQAPGNQIPQFLLDDAHGIAIVPGVVKLGFVVGVRHGRGVVLVRDEMGQWQPPTFITISGGSFGWQIGVQATDLILVFRTQRSVRGLMNGRLTLGADASVAAGPVGRQASAATDASLRSEIFSYSRSRGLFAGLALDGSVIHVDGPANHAFYQGRAGGLRVGDPMPLPPSAVRLMELVALHTGTQPPAAAVAPTGFLQSAPHHQEARQALVTSSRQLAALLDDDWKKFLALPAELYEGPGSPSRELMEAALRRYETVRGDAQFQSLAERPEFRATHEALRNYLDALTAPPRPTSEPITLPRPPQPTGR